VVSPPETARKSGVASVKARSSIAATESAIKYIYIRQLIARHEVITQRGISGFAATMTALVAGMERRGLTVFALVDHGAGAREAGLELENEQVIVFGNPRTGTPLMQDDPRIGIELPLRILVWQKGAEVCIGYRDPRELSSTYDVRAHEATLDQMAKLLEELATEAANS
jgi:uncharacterized protein (DUF302 family)